MTQNSQIGRTKLNNRTGRTKQAPDGAKKETSKARHLHGKLYQLEGCKAALADSKTKFGFESEKVT